MPADPQTRAAIAAHGEWLGFVQPVGLVVAPPVLVDRGVIIDRNTRPHQDRLDALLNDDDTAVAEQMPRRRFHSLQRKIRIGFTPDS